MATSYWLRLGRRTEGPIPLDELRRRACRGAVTPAHSVSPDGISWIAARRCAELFSADGSALEPGAGELLDGSAADGDSGWQRDLPTAASQVRGAAEAPERPAACRPGEPGVAAWPAHLACVLTLAVACALPMARDATGALWWWNVERVWQLGGARPVTASIAWAIVSALMLASCTAIWVRGGPGRLMALTASAIASMALATLAWGTGMAGGVWTLPLCATIPAVLLACRRSADRRTSDRRQHGGAHQVDIAVGMVAALGGLATLLGAVAAFTRDGGAALACSILTLISGAAMVGNAIRWRAAGPDEWTTLVPVGAAILACLAILCDGVAALAATPVPPVEGTRFAVLDAVRVICVLLCQCALAYLAQGDCDEQPSSRLAHQPPPGSIRP